MHYRHICVVLAVQPALFLPLVLPHRHAALSSQYAVEDHHGMACSLRVHPRERLTPHAPLLLLRMPRTKERMEEREHALSLPLRLDRIRRICVDGVGGIDLRAAKRASIVLLSAASGVELCLGKVSL